MIRIIIRLLVLIVITIATEMIGLLFVLFINAIVATFLDLRSRWGVPVNAYWGSLAPATFTVVDVNVDVDVARMVSLSFDLHTL